MALSAALLHLLLQIKHTVEKSLEPRKPQDAEKNTDNFCALPYCFFLKGKGQILQAGS